MRPCLSDAVSEIWDLSMDKGETFSDWESAEGYSEEMIRCESNQIANRKYVMFFQTIAADAQCDVTALRMLWEKIYSIPEEMHERATQVMHQYHPS